MSKADAISLLNAVFGFSALVFLFTQQLSVSFSLILLALLADGLDGIVARKTGKSQIGEYLEAMADMLSLAVAPLLFYLFAYSEVVFSSNSIRIVTAGLMGFFLVASILRLSSFHILKQTDYFVGFPASVSTLFILVVSIEQVSFFITSTVLLLCGLFMLSTIRFPKPRRYVLGGATLLIILSIVWGNQIALLRWVLFGALFCYSIGGPVMLFVKKKA